MKKKILTLALVAALAAVTIIGASLAYFTDTKTANNTFTVGNVAIDLTEPKWVSSGSVDAPEVYPGEPLAKDPTVKNTGENPCFVRIKVEGLDQFSTPAAAMPIIYRTDWTDNKLGTDWVLHTDGYFYYSKVLAAGVTTDALFDQIVIPTALTNGVASTEYNVIVTAQAVQAQGANGLNWTGVQGMDVNAIETWFNTVIPVAP